jgi:hypothetical protein
MPSAAQQHRELTGAAPAAQQPPAVIKANHHVMKKRKQSWCDEITTKAARQLKETIVVNKAAPLS